MEGSEKVTFFGYTIGDWAEVIKLHEQSLADLGQHLRTHDDELGSHSVRITRLEDHVGIKGEDNHED